MVDGAGNYGLVFVVAGTDIRAQARRRAGCHHGALNERAVAIAEFDSPTKTV